MMTWRLLLTVAATAWGVWQARHDYRVHGRVTALGLISVLLMFAMPHVVLDAAMDYGGPQTPLDFAGVALGAVGAAICIAAFVSFRSARKVLCLHRGKLAVGGVYRWSRNPQYVGYGLVFLGLALNGWTPWCLLAIALYLIVVHLLVLVEEEHLRRAFGDDYLEFCRRTPRYVGPRAGR
jgi:protein-S-isoprenylcysteine O-methyltransferase Ste14